MYSPKIRSACVLALFLALAGAVACTGETENQGEPEKGAEIMTIAAGTSVSLEYTLKLDDETVVESNVGATPLTYTHGDGSIIPGLERELEGLVVGDVKDVVIAPADGYGPLHDEAVQEVPLEQIPENARHAGAVLQGQSPDGGVVRARVTEVKDATAVVDFNHPLAGQTLHFAVKVLDIQKVAPAIEKATE
jgi:FKBP-type peptidyl-prolyl cis-trans isomerase SlyD